MAPRPGSFLVVPLLAVLTVLLSGCGGGPPAPTLPAAADLLTRSATAMAATKTLGADIQVDPRLQSLPIRAANGKLTSTGDATGSATLNQGGSSVELQFVIAAGRLYLKGPTGQYQQLPLAFAASIYDPRALLSAERGIPALLRTATNGNTEAREDVNGVPTYRVRAGLDPALVGSVLPGLTGTSGGTVWLDAANNRLVKAQLDVPTSAGGPTAPVTITLSDFDAPVTVAPPA